MGLTKYIYNSISSIGNFEYFVIFTYSFKIILENFDKSDNFSRFSIHSSETQKKACG